MSLDHIYQRGFDPAGADALARIARKVRLGSTILELGPAVGYFTRYLTETLRCTVDCVEFSKEMAERSRVWSREMCVGDLDTLDLPAVFPGRHYDCVIAADVLEHLKDPWRVLEMCRTMLSPGGHLLLSVPNVGHASLVAALLEGRFEYRGEGLLDKTHLRFFNRRSLLKMLREAGFRVEAMETLTMMPEHTEYGQALDPFSPKLRSALLSHPDALVYQFILSAMPGSMEDAEWEELLKDRGSPRLRFQVGFYWAGEGEDFSEERCRFAWGDLGETRQMFRFSLPASSSLRRLRLDPADREGFFHLHSVRLLRSTKDSLEALWGLSSPVAIAEGAELVNVAFRKNENLGSFLSHNNDPALIFRLPDNLWRGDSGDWVFEIVMDWPMTSDYLLFKPQMESPGHQETNLGPIKDGSLSVLESILRRQQRSLESIEGRLMAMNGALEAKEKENGELRTHVAGLNNELVKTWGSFSWRVTRPFRFAGRFAKTILKTARMAPISRSVGKAEIAIRRGPIGGLLKRFGRTTSADLVVPSNALRGALEWPTAESAVEDGHLKILGWVFGVESPVKRLSARIDRGSAIELHHGLERKDVSSKYPNFPEAESSGFIGELPADWIRKEWVTVDVETELENGRKLLVFSRRVHLPEARRFRWSFRLRNWARSGIKSAGPSLRRALKGPPDGEPSSKEFRGMLELPLSLSSLENGLLKISGWVFSNSSPIVQLTARLGRESPVDIHTGLRRPDVLKAFANDSAAEFSGFEGSLPAIGSRRVQFVHVEARMADGRTVSVFHRRVKLMRESAKPDGLRRRARFASALLGKSVRAIRSGRWPRTLGEARARYGAVRDAFHYQQQISEGLRHPWEVMPPFDRWLSHNRFTPNLVRLLRDSAETIKSDGPKISVIVPVYNPPLAYLKKMVHSVRAQIYPHWELCIADDASTKPHVKEFLSRISGEDSRIKVVIRPANGHICEASNSALALSSGDFVAFLDHDDELTPDALLLVAESLKVHPEADWFYSDEDKIDPAGRRYDPQFKGAYSPEMALTHNFTHHLTVIRRSLVKEAGGFRVGFEGAQDLDLFLRAAELTRPEKIVHIPYVCYHWRAHGESTALNGRQKEYIFTHAKKAIEEALQRRNLRAAPFLPDFASTNDLCLFQLRWSPVILKEHPVTIVIPTKDRMDLLKPCIASLEATVDPSCVQLLIMDDRTSDPQTLAYLEALPSACSLKTRVIKPGRGDGTFNFARLINESVEQVTTPFVLFLNNDIEAKNRGWLEDMAGWLSVPGVGAVGARLLFPDGNVQHAGVAIGPHEGLADHFFVGNSNEDMGYLFLAKTARNVSAVTGACFLMRADDFRRVGGMDEKRFPVAYNDVDLCLRLGKEGLRMVYSPQATLVHHTSASRGADYDPAEHQKFLELYGGLKDPFINPNLDIRHMSLMIDPHRVGHVERVRVLKMLLVTHNLNYEGAPIFLFDLAAHLVKKEGFSIQLISSADGPLRRWYEDIGIPVRVLEEPMPNGDSASVFGKRLKKLGSSIDWDFDIIGCNTLNSFWAVELASLMDKPSLWYIHESLDVHKFFAHLDPSLRNMIPSCFAKATRTVIAAKATVRVHHPLDKLNTVRIVPVGLPMEKIRSFRKANDKGALRAKYGLPEGKKIVTIVGTTCERKGQHVFVQAVERLQKEFPGSFKGALFLIVGGRESAYLVDLKKQIARSPAASSIRIFMETPDIYDFYGLSDLFVCASSEESFPMVILLAMAFNLPIVSTDVFGIAEILTNEVDGLLVKPGNPADMAERIHRLLKDPVMASRLARHAWHTVHRRFDARKTLPRQADLCREAFLCHAPKEAHA